MDYDFALSGEAENCFEQLLGNPFEEGDFQEKSGTGRTYHVKGYDDLIITYWVDHSEKEIRIILVETIE